MSLKLDNLVELHDLSQSSFVVDVGGYLGDYSQKVLDKFDCSILIFEPHPVMYEHLLKRFIKAVNVSIENKALTRIGVPELYQNLDGSTLYESWYKKNQRINDEKLQVQGILASKRLKGLSIDVLKLNCEGSEYDIIEDLHEHGMLKDIDELLIQFHKVPELLPHYRKCIDFLSKTHEKVFNHKWQLWKKM